MPMNRQTDRCIRTERGALVFSAPGAGRLRDGSRVQIVDVFALQVATGYTRDPHGRLLLESQPSVAAGRSWSLAKAAQLIRNDARPHRWVALQLDKRAWGLFWAGGGLQRCRELLADRVSEVEACTALVPATPEALLRLMLELEPQGQQSARTQPWALIGWTSLAWLTLLGITVAGFWGALERQERKLDRLLQQVGQTTDLIQRGSPGIHRPLTIR